jgi:16S rRNA processing protein RimM
MGRVAGSYGVRGWLKVQSPQAALAACKRWRIGGKEFAVEALKEHSGTLLAKLSGLESREAALELKGSSVYVRREALPEPDAGHYYLADLVGLEVLNERGEALGVVRRWMFNGAQDVMEVAANGKTRLLPWVAQVVRDVDLEKRQIHVNWGADW